MIAEYCEGIDASFLEDKNGKIFKLPKTSDANYQKAQIFYEDRIESALKSLLKEIDIYNNFYYGMRIKTDQQRTAKKLHLFKKLKFKRK